MSPKKKIRPIKIWVYQRPDKQAKLEAAVVRAATSWYKFSSKQNGVGILGMANVNNRLYEAVGNLERFLKSSKGVK